MQDPTREINVVVYNTGVSAEILKRIIRGKDTSGEKVKLSPQISVVSLGQNRWALEEHFSKMDLFGQVLCGL